MNYTSEIIDGGNGAPLFRVTPEDDPEHPFVATTSSSTGLYITCLSLCAEVWVDVLKKVKRRQTVSVSGPEVTVIWRIC